MPLLQEVFIAPDTSVGSALWQPFASLAEYDAVENWSGVLQWHGPLPTSAQFSKLCTNGKLDLSHLPGGWGGGISGFPMPFIFLLL